MVEEDEDEVDFEIWSLRNKVLMESLFRPEDMGGFGRSSMYRTEGDGGRVRGQKSRHHCRITEKMTV